jgi:hypothetical protein
MRLFFLCCVTLILLATGFMSSSVSAQDTRLKPRSDLATCNCHFGYGGSCVTVLACTVEGGRCAGSCVPQPEFEWPETSRSGAPSAQGGAH